jgi:hypothetical protein
MAMELDGEGSEEKGVVAENGGGFEVHRKNVGENLL